MKTLNRINEYLTNLFAAAGGVALFLMMVISVANMTMRYFGKPLGPAYELVGFLGAVTVSFPLAYAQVKRSHIAVDILSSRFSRTLRRTVAGIGLVLGMMFFCLATWQVAVFANTMRLTGELSETTKMSYYHFVFAVSAGCGLMVFSLLVDFMNLVTGQSTDEDKLK